MKGLIREYAIRTFDGTTAGDGIDDVITERPLDIIINGHRVVTIACTGHYLKELALGYLKSEGLIAALDDVIEIDVTGDPPSAAVTLREQASGTSAGGGTVAIMSSGARGKGPGTIEGPLRSKLRFPARHALSLMDLLLSSSPLHKRTHGAHCSALADEKGLIVYRDDIGRHNTYDMLGGYTLLEGIDCSDKIVVTTGRVSTEIVMKVYRMGIPVIISHAVPTSRALELCRDAGITLIGYVRRGTMKIYAHEERVLC